MELNTFIITEFPDWNPGDVIDPKLQLPKEPINVLGIEQVDPIQFI